MQFEIRTRGVEVDTELRVHAARALTMSLGGRGNRVGRVLFQVSADRLGETVVARCHVQAEVLGFGTVVVEERGSDVVTATKVAVDRTAAAITRLLDGRPETHATLEARPAAKPLRPFGLSDGDLLHG